MSEQDFTGKVAIVTGASRGIGRTISLALAERGAAVVGTARRLDSSEGTGGTLRGTIDALPEVVAGVNGRVPVLIDSGIRRGADIFKALAESEAPFAELSYEVLGEEGAALATTESKAKAKTT